MLSGLTEPHIDANVTLNLAKEDAMSNDTTDCSSEVRNVLWTEAGIRKWIEGRLYLAKSRSAAAHTQIRMSVIINDAHIEMIRIRFCAACGVKTHQTSQTVLEWKRMRTCCDGKVDESRCMDCGRDGLKTVNHRCGECRTLWNGLEQIIQEVADKRDMPIKAASVRNVFASARRVRQPASVAPAELLVPESSLVPETATSTDAER
ncbi:hypothetical protein HQ524_02515, partial [Candidatus Uhrbacteria bacterium]|nr:hypothetical protein [Candidatus Uhrbacteria bacterium]